MKRKKTKATPKSETKEPELLMQTRRRRRAIKLSKAGIPLVALRPHSKAPMFEGGVHNPLRSPEAVKAFFDEHPDANYGIVTGAESGVFGVDVDGAEGIESLTESLESEFGPLRSTVQVDTPNGFHLMLKHPGTPVRNSVGKIAPGIDIRGDGGYLVGPWCEHPEGGFYRYKKGNRPEDVGYLKAPAGLVKLVCRPDEPEDTEDAVASSPLTPEAYGAAALRDETIKVRTATEGRRNDQLNRSAFRLGQLVGAELLNEAAARRELRRAAQTTGLSDDEIRRTIKSGLCGGKKSPRRVQGAAMTSDDGDALAAELALLGESDADNARRFAKRCAGRAVYSSGHAWFVFDGKRWTDDKGKLYELAIDTVEKIGHEVPHLRETASRRRHSQHSKSRAAIESMLALAGAVAICVGIGLRRSPRV